MDCTKIVEKLFPKSKYSEKLSKLVNKLSQNDSVTQFLDTEAAEESDNDGDVVAQESQATVSEKSLSKKSFSVSDACDNIVNNLIEITDPQPNYPFALKITNDSESLIEGIQLICHINY